MSADEEVVVAKPSWQVLMMHDGPAGLPDATSKLLCLVERLARHRDQFRVETTERLQRLSDGVLQAERERERTQIYTEMLVSLEEELEIQKNIYIYSESVRYII